jgi:alpha-L-rhamnosidase
MIDSFDANAFLAKWLGDIRDGQRPDGSISMIDPIRDGCCYAWAPEWTGAYPIVAWELYVKYADRGVLQSHYDALKKYLGWQTGALVDGIAPASTWGDWYSPGYSYGPEDRRLSATAYVYRQLTIMADIARVLGHSEDAAGYLATAGQVRQRFNETFFNAGAGQYVTATDPGYRQTSNALPVAFGIVPDQDRKAVVDGLAADVRAHGGHLNTGILGTPALLDVLTRNGYVDLAHGIASQTTFPSWGEWLNAGADTLWEQWGLGARSRNHPMFGTIDDWFYRDVAGLSADPSVPGYQHAIIQPWPTPTLSTATAKYASRYGEIKVAWLAQADRFTLDVRIPVNATATVRVPVTASAAVSESGRPAARAPGVRYVRTADGYAEFEIGSGNYHFVARTPAANAPASAE